MKKKKNEKQIIFCGVTNSDGSPAKLTEDEKNKFLKNMGGDQYHAVYCDTPPIITLSINNNAERN